jgi:hypothetical protein
MLQKQVVSLELMQLLKELQSMPVLREHYLAGGTALALQIKEMIECYKEKYNENNITLLKNTMMEII